nr:VCBS domain-containing protein [Hyphomicrobium sp.]
MAVSKLVKKTKTITFAELCGDAKPIIKSAPASAKIKELAEGNGPGTENPNFIHEKKGNIKFFDSDAKDTHKVAFTPLGGNYLGTFKLGTVNQKTDNIPWSFKVKDGVIDTLAEGQTLTQKYRVTITDSQGNKVSQIVTIKIEGTNDAPTITSPEQKASVVELTDANPNENNFQHEKGGAVTFNDVDKIDKHTATFVPQAGSYIGTFAIGSVSQATDTIPWTFKIDDAILEGLSEKDVIVQKYDVTVSDGKGGFATQTVTITITGTDDPLGFNGLALQGADVTVYEAGLADGSTPGDAGAPITKSGFFNIFAGDDVGSLTIAGVTVIAGGAVVPAALNVPIATTYGALTITAINL